VRESDLEARLVRGVKSVGGQAYKFVSPGSVGVPDRLVVLPGGKIIFVELKADGGRLSQMQVYWIAQLRGLGADVQVVKGAEDVKKFLQRLREVIPDEIHTP